MPRRQPRMQRGRLPRCNHCRHFIRWFRFRGSWRAFSPSPVDPKKYPGTGAYPVVGKTAWPVQDLVDNLLANGVLGPDDNARDHVDAMPWHVLHACPPDPKKKDS